MRLALSSAALPDAPLHELATAAARRGFAGVVLECAGEIDVDAARRSVEDAGLRVLGVRMADGAAAHARMAARLDAPLITPVVDAAAAVAAARSWQDSGADAALTLDVTGAPVDVLEAAASLARCGLRGIGLGWVLRPDAAAPLEAGARLREVAATVRHIRLHGGGPETQTQGGTGIGTLMAQLALSGFDGVVSLAPGNPRFRTAWAFWLGRHGGTGCGSKKEERTLVLPPARPTAAPGH